MKTVLPSLSRNTVTGKFAGALMLRAIFSPGSSYDGYVTGYCAAKRSAEPRLSFALRPTKAICLPCAVETCCRIGSSARHGPHQEAHLLITTGWPFSAASRASNALVPPSSSWLDCSWSFASGAGAPASCRLAFARSNVPVGSELPPACVRPMTTTATSAAAARSRRGLRILLRVADRRLPQPRLLQCEYFTGGRSDGGEAAATPRSSFEPVDVPPGPRTCPQSSFFRTTSALLGRIHASGRPGRERT